LPGSPRVRLADRTNPRRPARLAATVAEDLIDAIVSGRLPAESVLPGEQALCEEFGVSRVVVREALKALEHKGLLIIRQGQGTVVAPVTRWDPLDSTVLDARIRHDDGLGLLDNLVQVRCALESELAGTAATRRTERQLIEMNSVLAAMECVLGQPEQYLALEVEFHDHIMQMAGNDVARAVVTSIHDHARDSSRYCGGELDKQITAAHIGHVAIAQAIADADDLAARTAMRAHILDSWHSKRSQQTGPPDAEHECSCHPGHQLEGTHLQRANMGGAERSRL
jgi:DNA-binding FadR family transcriptional regulator